MGEQIKTFSKEARKRWKAKMPRFFNRVCWVCSLISGTALAANEAMQLAGATPHEWWTSIFPYLVGIPAGMAFAAKFTMTYPQSKNAVLEHDNF